MGLYKHKTLVILILSYCFCYSTFSLAAQAPKPVIWNIQSNKIASSIQFHLEQRSMARIKELSDGELVFNVVPVDSIFAAKSTFNAVRSAKVEGMFMSPQFWGGADIVFTIYGDLVAAWETQDQYRQWLEQEQGIRYLQATYHRFGLHQVGYMVSPMESIISQTPIANLADFAGKNIRTPPGMITDFFRLLGAKPKQMSISQVMESLENHRISMADYSNIVVNEKAGLYGLAKHTNFPGFHSMSLLDFVVNKKAWDSLTPEHQKIVNIVIKDWEKSLDEELELKQQQVVRLLVSQGVTLYRWDEKELKKARNIAQQVWHKYALKSPEASNVISQLMAWLKLNGNI
ncbi:TRAP transporter substrate-binding protein DctP [Gammaproteobacteria bacterium AS21]